MKLCGNFASTFTGIPHVAKDAEEQDRLTGRILVKALTLSPMSDGSPIQETLVIQTIGGGSTSLFFVEDATTTLRDSVTIEWSPRYSDV